MKKTSLLIIFMLVLLIGSFAGFAYMHYYSVGGVQFVTATLPEIPKKNV